MKTSTAYSSIPITKGSSSTILQANDNTLQCLLESLDEAVALIDCNYTAIFLNQLAKQTANDIYNVDLAAGSNMVFDFPKECREELQLFYNCVLEGETIHFERKANNTGSWVRCYFTPVRDASGKVTGICARVKNITQQKKAEEADPIQKESECFSRKNYLLFEQFMNHSPLVGWITDEKGIMRYMNPVYQKTYGFTGAHIGKSIFDMFPDQLAVDYYLNNMKVIRDGKPIETTENACLPDGKEQVLKIYKFPLCINGVDMVAGWGVDLSEVLILQQELEKSVERYHYVNEATSDAIYDWDLKSGRIYRGSAFQTLFGYPQKEVSLKTRLSLIHPDDLETFKAAVFSALRDLTQNTWKVEYRFRDASGAYRNVVDRAFIQNYDGNAVRVIGAIQDVTEQKQLQRRLLQEEKGKKREIVRSIIETQEKERRKLSVELHDNVNQMLASCKLMLEVACDGGDNAPKLIKKSYQSLNQIITEIRKISHDLNPSVIQDIGLIESITQMTETINATGKLQITFINNTCAQKDFLKEADRISIYRIIQEQVSNILKHSQATNATITLSQTGNIIGLTIADNGQGFDEEKIK
ncbi:MAG TPA: PAS domain S-box protein, partial [Flavisolibacter sp.]